MPLLASVPAPQLSKQAKRLYVGNVPPEVTDDELIVFFNKAMIDADHAKEPCVVSSQLNHDKSFSFIEFRTVEEATAGMNLDGINLRGQALKIRRPKDYQAPPAPVLLGAAGGVGSGGLGLPAIGGLGANVPDNPNKIFIGGLPSYLDEDQVKDLITTFGPLKNFNLVKDNATGNSKGYAFFEYMDPNVTDRACAALNGMKLGEKTLLVQRSYLGPKNTFQLPPPGAQPTNPTAANFLNLSLPAATMLTSNLLGPGVSTTETRVLELLNMIRAEELMKDEDFDEVVADVRAEAEKYGRLLSMVVPRPRVVRGDIDWKVDPDNPVPGVGRVFLEYASTEEARKAQQALAGRRFGGRVVLTSFFDEEAYARQDFSH
jgi:splicing factor U2AF subunit